MPLSLDDEAMNEKEAAGKLFGDLPVPRKRVVEVPAALGAARVLMPNRKQMEFRASDLESLLPEGHRARLVWGYVERQDLSAMYAPIKAREGGVGRTAIAPEILFALWLYATLDGVGSGREVARLTQEHDAYRWICGGVQVNYHTVCDFRVEHGEALDELLSENIAALMGAGVVKLKAVAQDGMRVRASAGAGSFRREEKLKGYLEQAKHEVARLRAELQADPPARSRRQAAAQARAAREREARIEQALARLPELAEIKRRQAKPADQARASMTDADASVMKMGDGGFRPAFNVQYATDTESQVIVGADVVTAGSDLGQLAPMVEQVRERCASAPERWLVDGGYPAHEQIDAVAEHTNVYAPVPKSKDENVQVHAPKASDSEAVAKWRVRMGSAQAKGIYKDRAATAECVNAQARARGLTQLRVRGTRKVMCVVLLFALAHNLLRAAQLAPQLLGIGTGTSAIPGITG
jgi:transposase